MASFWPFFDIQMAISGGSALKFIQKFVDISLSPFFIAFYMTIIIILWLLLIITYSCFYNFQHHFTKLPLYLLM